MSRATNRGLLCRSKPTPLINSKGSPRIHLDHCTVYDLGAGGVHNAAARVVDIVWDEGA